MRKGRKDIKREEKVRKEDLEGFILPLFVSAK